MNRLLNHPTSGEAFATMSNTPQVERLQAKKPSRSWFQFSLRTFLILTVVVAGVLSQAVSEIATARKRSQAISSLEAAGYLVEVDSSNGRTRRWITSIIPQSQWNEWFPNGDWERLDRMALRPLSSPPTEVLTKGDAFRLLSAFQSCREVSLVTYQVGRDGISATDITTFHGWKGIESYEFFGGSPDDSAMKLIATSTNLRRLRISSVIDFPRERLTQFLDKSTVKDLELVRVSFVGDAPWPPRHSLQSVELDNTNLTWDEVGELLANGPIESLNVSFRSNQKATNPWNSGSLVVLQLNNIHHGELDLLGNLPALGAIQIKPADGEFDVEALGRLSRFSGLASVTYSGPIETSVMDQFGKIPSLRDLRLTRDKVGECSLESIALLTNLRLFDADLSDLTPNDVAVLRSLRNLEVVHLKWRQSLEVMIPLLDSPSLRTLSFSIEKHPQPAIDAFLRLAGERGVLATLYTGSTIESNERYLQPKAPKTAPGSETNEIEQPK